MICIMEDIEYQVSKVKVLPYNEREDLKQKSYKKYGDEMRWHRFIDSMFDVDVPLEERRYIPEIHPTLNEYKVWLRDYPGWSQGLMSHKHSAWQSSMEGQSFPFHEFLERCISQEEGGYIVSKIEQTKA